MTGRRVRRQLTARFPGTRFSVRSDALGNTVAVTWQGGPTEEEVRRLTRFHSRDWSPPGGIAWIDRAGSVCVVEPLALVVLDRGADDRDLTGDRASGFQ